MAVFHIMAASMKDNSEGSSQADETHWPTEMLQPDR